MPPCLGVSHPFLWRWFLRQSFTHKWLLLLSICTLICRKQTRRGGKYILQMLKVKFSNKIVITNSQVHLSHKNITRTNNDANANVTNSSSKMHVKLGVWDQRYLMIYPCLQFLLNRVPLWTWDCHSPYLNQTITRPKSHLTPK